MSEREQKLVDICFSVGLTISDQRYNFKNMSEEDRAKWIAKQLKECGFETTPVGSSWGVLESEDKSG